MKKYRKLLWLVFPIPVLGISFLIIPSLRSQEEEPPPIPYSIEEMFLEELTLPPPVINITIKEREKLPYAIKPGEYYPITWIIEGLEEGQEVTHTDIHWAYLVDLNNLKEIEDYKNYPNKGREFSWNQDEYTDEIYLYPYDVKLPAIMLVIHATVDGKEYTFGPMPIDIVPNFEE